MRPSVVRRSSGLPRSLSARPLAQVRAHARVCVSRQETAAGDGQKRTGGPRKKGLKGLPPSLPRQCHECLVNSDVIQNLAKLALARVLGNIFGHKEEDQIGDLANYCVAKAVDVPWTCSLMMFDLEEQ